MTFTVITISAAQADIAEHLLPATDRIARSAERLDFFYQTNGGENYGFNDLDGNPLVECHTFETLAEADAWAREDMRGLS